MSDSRTEHETKIYYYNGNDDVPILIRLPIPSPVTLGDFKAAINLRSAHRSKFFFKTESEDVGGICKEQILDDATTLPSFKGKIICYIESQEDEETTSGFGRAHATDDDDDDDESLYSRSYHGGGGHRPHRYRYDDCSDDDASSRVSTSTNETSVSSFNPLHAARMLHRMPSRSKTTSVSSLTDSSVSLSVIDVVLDLPEPKMLGMSLVGHSSNEKSGGIYVGALMKGGAAAADGRIGPGDMILAVNDTDLSNMSNDQAVEILREAVDQNNQIKIVVAKQPFDSNQYFTIPRGEPIQPINLEAWVHSTEVATGVNEYPLRPPSVSTFTSRSSSIPSSYAESESRKLISEETKYTNDMETILKVLSRPGSGLTIKNRKWLKLEIPNAFIGSEFVDWLRAHVAGFSGRKEAQKFAVQMLKEGYIKPTINKKFSPHCYYVLKTPNELMNEQFINANNTYENNSLASKLNSIQLNYPINSSPHWQQTQQGNNNGANYQHNPDDLYNNGHWTADDYCGTAGSGSGHSGGGDSSHPRSLT